MTVRTRKVPIIHQWLATLDGSTTANIQPQVTGYIEAVNYEEGSVVETGQILFTLDQRPFEAAVDKARGDHAQAVAALGKSRADVARYTPLVAQRAISREQLDNAHAAVLEAEGNVQATQGLLDTARINLEWTEVRSPIRGRTGLAQTRVGTLVNPSQVLTTVSTLDPMRASFSLSQQEYLEHADDINHYDPTKKADFYFELILVNGRVFPDRARRLVANRQIDPQTGTLQMQAFFPNPSGVLRPGMFGKVSLHAGTDEALPTIPERALTELQGRYQVTVLDEQRRVQTRQIQLGQQFDHEYVVSSGLRAGERVIVEGQQNLIPGAQLQPFQVQPAPGPPAAP